MSSLPTRDQENGKDTGGGNRISGTRSSENRLRLATILLKKPAKECNL